VPGVLGFVDGTEIEIVKPEAPLNAQAYWSHKHHYALNVQVVSTTLICAFVLTVAINTNL